MSDRKDAIMALGIAMMGKRSMELAASDPQALCIDLSDYLDASEEAYRLLKEVHLDNEGNVTSGDVFELSPKADGYGRVVEI